MADAGEKTPTTPSGHPAGPETESASTPVAKKPAMKATPKSPAKTKPPAESKASAKKKSKKPPTLKKPAAVIKNPTLKKPAAQENKTGKQGSGKTVPPKVEDWEKGIEPMELDLTAEQGEEEALQEDDPVHEVDFFETNSEKKDRVKDAKFKKMYDNGDLPDYLMKAWDKTLTMKVGRTSKQRELVNSCFDRMGGGLQLNLDKPLFKQYQVLTSGLTWHR